MSNFHLVVPLAPGREAFSDLGSMEEHPGKAARWTSRVTVPADWEIYFRPGKQGGAPSTRYFPRGQAGHGCQGFGFVLQDG